MFENRRWLVIPISITSSINFNEVLESSLQSLRLSLDGAETFVKYDITEVTASYTTEYIDAQTGQMASSSIAAGIYGRPSIYSSSYSEYNHQEILDILTGSNWSLPFPENPLP
jgi:hypothetical protein